MEGETGCNIYGENDRFAINRIVIEPLNANLPLGWVMVLAVGGGLSKSGRLIKRNHFVWGVHAFEADKSQKSQLFDFTTSNKKRHDISLDYFFTVSDDGSI